MPVNFGHHHDRFLDWFLENDRMKSLEKGQIFNFGLKKTGFIFALWKRLRLDTFEDDFGVSGFFKETCKNQDYLIFAEDNTLIGITTRLYRNIFARHYVADQSDPRIRLYDISLFLPMLQTNDLKFFNEDECLVESIYTESLFIFPLNPSYLHFFQKRAGGAKKNLYGLLSVLNFQDFGFLEVKFRKCIIETSVKGIYFYHIEFWSFRRLRKTQEKLEKL